MFVLTDENGRILATTNIQEYAEGMDEFDFPDDFDFFDQSNWKIVDGSLEFDPLPVSEEEKARELERERNKQLQEATILFVRTSAATLTDKQAVSISLLFDEWKVGTAYKRNEIIRYGEDLYRIGQDHTAQAQWVPGSTGVDALYSKIKIDEEGYEVWKEWDGVSGIYQKDQIVRDPNDNQLYKSKIPNNVWGPPSRTPDQWELYTE